MKKFLSNVKGRGSTHIPKLSGNPGVHGSAPVLALIKPAEVVSVAA